ncbi:hypothetical protein Q8A64_13325 [Oxalobacteraceae bacterium R-40]|uniref:Uncharacterized protein n=1 Tax=Keguizhuia sedimenti TaxID=3064264 RepID=A0ABU1BR90_9BURK|nr:hypothetical protein [Oxalobacteraceae bacterium R-40]
MTPDEVLELFRQQAADMQKQAPTQNDLIQELSLLLSESRGKLSKENFDALVRLGGALYKTGLDQFNARQNVSDIMQRSARDHEDS